MEVAPSRVAGASRGCEGAKSGAGTGCAVQPAFHHAMSNLCNTAVSPLPCLVRKPILLVNKRLHPAIWLLRPGEAHNLVLAPLSNGSWGSHSKKVLW